MKMSFSFKLESHPGTKLVKHLENVGNLSNQILSSKEFENKDLFSNIAYLIGIAHDFGKATTHFQKKLRTQEDSKYSYHSFLSSFLGYFITKKSLERENKQNDFWFIPVIAWLVINKHHGNIRNLKGTDGEISKLQDDEEIETIFKQLKDIKENNFVEVMEIYKLFNQNTSVGDFFDKMLNKSLLMDISKSIYRDARKLVREKDIQYYFYVLLFYSTLLDADKLDASGQRRIPERILNLSKSIVERYKEKKFGKNEKKEIDNIREKATQEIMSALCKLDLNKNRTLSINLPTGLGKTLSGFSFALGLRERVEKEKGFTPKIIYSLPFLSIIDQNSQVISEVLETDKQSISSNLMLVHHYLADVKYTEEKNNEIDIIKDINRALLLTEGWHSEIVITTFIQLFHSLITNRNRAARKFHNMTNSIIILDEIQAIPHKYWLLINKALCYLTRQFNCWIILMTATEPLIFSSDEITPLIKEKNKYFTAMDRVQYKFDLKEKDFSKFKKEVLAMIKENEAKDIMIVLNTIRSCKDMYIFLKEKFSKETGSNIDGVIDEYGISIFPDFDLINLSTHVLPDFRQRRISKIKENENLKKKRMIIITTQLIEAGVDISVDIIYRDFAPLDCIIQAAGRCNRNNRTEKGVVNVVLLKGKNNQLLCSIYDSTLRDITKEVILNVGKNTSEKDFCMKATNDYYKLVLDRGTSDNSRVLLNHMHLLNFSELSNFKLIEQKMETKSIFIEINSEAEELRKTLEKIMTENKRFEKRVKLLELRKQLNLFTLSVNYDKRLACTIEQLEMLGEMEDFRVVSKDQLNEWYILDIGFRTPEFSSGVFI